MQSSTLPSWIEDLEKHGVYWAKSPAMAIQPMIFRETGLLLIADLVVWDGEFREKYGDVPKEEQRASD